MESKHYVIPHTTNNDQFMNHLNSKNNTLRGRNYNVKHSASRYFDSAICINYISEPEGSVTVIRNWMWLMMWLDLCHRFILSRMPEMKSIIENSLLKPNFDKNYRTLIPSRNVWLNCDPGGRSCMNFFSYVNKFMMKSALGYIRRI